MQRFLRQMSRPPARVSRFGSCGYRCATSGRPTLQVSASDAATAPPYSTSTTSTTTTGTSQPQPETARNSHGAVVPPVASATGLADLPYYSQYPLDRHDDWRRDQKKLDELFSRNDAKLIPLLRDMVLVRPSAAASVTAATDGGATATGAAGPLLHPVLLSPAAAQTDSVAGSPARVFLGTDADGAPFFAAAVTSPAAARELASSHLGSEWRSARVAGPDLAPGDASLLAVASGLMVWHSANPFSAATGAPTAPSPGGFSRKCTGGSGSAYPRIDPAVIMLVTHRGDFALLGRKAEWPADRYSTLAGFLELGEALEAAVAREVEEEAGVRVDLASVTYAASQPWPFPRSLMIGFNASTVPRSAAASATAAAGDTSTGSTAASPAGDSNGNGAGGSIGGAYTLPSSPTSSVGQWWQPAPTPARGFDLLPPLGRRAALDAGIFAEEVQEVLGPLQDLPWPVADKDELQDVRWFHRDWIRAVFQAPGGAAAVAGAGRFNVPGPYSLAYRLITAWAGCVPYSPGAAAAAAAAAWSGDCVPQVLISGSGTFKYMLLRLWDPRAEGGGRSKLLVTGDTRASYHNDLLQKAKALARPLELKVSPLGGGRIHHDPQARTVQVYGYSAAFGPAPHEVTAALIHRWFPLYDKESITVSYEGY